MRVIAQVAPEFAAIVDKHGSSKRPVRAAARKTATATISARHPPPETASAISPLVQPDTAAAASGVAVARCASEKATLSSWAHAHARASTSANVRIRASES
jgi:hypothetical protein